MPPEDVATCTPQTYRSFQKCMVISGPRHKVRHPVSVSEQGAAGRLRDEVPGTRPGAE